MLGPIIKKPVPPQQGQFQSEPILEKLLGDFVGGMNVTDAPELLPDNTFSEIKNLVLDRQGRLVSRDPYRPFTFNANIVDSRVRRFQTASLVYSSHAQGDLGANYTTVTFTTTHNLVAGDRVFFTGVTGTPWPENWHGTTGMMVVSVPTTSSAQFHVTYDAGHLDFTTSTITEQYLDTVSSLFDYKIIKTVVSGWSFDGEIHVIGVQFTSGDIGVLAAGVQPSAWSAGSYDKDDLVVYNNRVYRCNEDSVTATPGADYHWQHYTAWTELWASATASDVRLIPYQINGAVDILIFPDDTNPERFSFSSTTKQAMIELTGSTTDLGLTKPGVGDFSVVFTDAAAGQGIEVQNGDVIYYKYSYVYDDPASTTRYGESSTQAMTTSASHTITGATGDETVNHAFTDSAIPSGVKKIRIYRAPINNSSGPFLYLGESVATTNPDGEGGGVFPDFLDKVPVGQEGIEDLPSGTNPSVTGSELTILNPTLVGSSIVGFDSAMKNKLIYSDPGSPDIWNPLNFDYLKGNGKTIIEFNRKIFSFTDEAVYQKETITGPAVLICSIGSVDGRSVQNVGNGLIWMGTDSVYFADFVQQYGSKGDFPKDIGHPIVTETRLLSRSYPVTAAFFERRYWLSYFDATDQTYKNWVFDVDWQAWQRIGFAHEFFAVGVDQLFSLSTQKSDPIGSGTAALTYVYEHGYSATITPVSVYDNVLGLIGHWKLDEYQTETTAEDSSDEENDLTLSAAASNLTTASKPSTQLGKAMNNDGTYTIGTSDTTLYDFTNPLQSFSVGYWANGNDNFGVGNAEIVQVMTINGWAFAHFGRAGLALRFTSQYDAGTSWMSKPSTIIETAEWHFLMATYDKDEASVKIYLDGQPMPMASVSLPEQSELYPAQYGFHIGSSGAGINIRRTDMDDVRIYNRPLSDSEVLSLYNQGLGTLGYSGTAAAVYEGTDYHDYISLDITNGLFADSQDIQCVLSRDRVRFNNIIDPYQISSAILSASGDAVDATVTFENESGIEREVVFSATSAQPTDYPAAYDSADSVYADGTDGDEDGYVDTVESADSDEYGYVAFSSTEIIDKKKVNRNLKDNSFTITLTIPQARNLKLNLMGFRYRVLPMTI